MLRLTLAINDDQIADYEIRRITNPGGPHDEADVNAYAIRSIPAGEELGVVHHRYGDGAQVLAWQALSALTGRRRPRPDPWLAADTRAARLADAMDMEPGVRLD